MLPHGRRGINQQKSHGKPPNKCFTPHDSFSFPFPTPDYSIFRKNFPLCLLSNRQSRRRERISSSSDLIVLKWEKIRWSAFVSQSSQRQITHSISKSRWIIDEGHFVIDILRKPVLQAGAKMSSLGVRMFPFPFLYHNASLPVMHCPLYSVRAIGKIPFKNEISCIEIPPLSLFVVYDRPPFFIIPLQQYTT
jgi:hypothetical protein